MDVWKMTIVSERAPGYDGGKEREMMSERMDE